MSTSTQFAVGDSVSWTHTSLSGSSWRFSTRNGKIINLAEDQALCKGRNGRKQWVLLRRLTRDGEPTELTKAFKAFMGMANQING